jgi:hypothetical protein
VSHYLDGVRSARKHEQNLIRRAVHWIQTLLVYSLTNGPFEMEVSEGIHLKNGTFQVIDSFNYTGLWHQMQVLTVFVLSCKFEPSDLALAVSNGLLPMLAEMCANSLHLLSTSPSLPVPIQGTPVLALASLRLLQVLAISTG